MSSEHDANHLDTLAAIIYEHGGQYIDRGDSEAAAEAILAVFDVRPNPHRAGYIRHHWRLMYQERDGTSIWVCARDECWAIERRPTYPATD